MSESFFIVAMAHNYCSNPFEVLFYSFSLVICNVTSVLITTILLVLMYNVKPGSGSQQTSEEFWILDSPLICSGLGYSLYIAGISMFCWMSVMCIDLCWTFAGAKIPRFVRICLVLLFF